MSEAFEPLPDRSETERVSEELQHVLGLKVLRHVTNLYEDAFQRQLSSGKLAKQNGLKFVDVFIQETTVETPADRAMAILLTRNGDWLRPSEPQPHFYVYFPVMDSRDGEATVMTTGINWLTRVEADGVRQSYVITEEGIRRSLSPEAEIDEAAFLLGGNTLLDPAEGRTLLEELRSFRLAPHVHYAKETE